MSLQYLAKLLLRIRLTFGKLLMMFVGVSKFGKTNLIFVDPAVKFNGTYWTRLTTKYGETCRRKTKVYDVGSSVYAMSGVLLSVINDPVAQASACVFSCRRKTFKHLMWLKSTPMLTFFLISWTLKANYCVKYVYRFFLFLTFCISQGSVAIRVRCDEKYNKDFAAKLLPSQTVKNFENRTTFGYLTPKARVACFWLIV